MSAKGKITASAIYIAVNSGEKPRIQVRIRGMEPGRAAESWTKVKDAVTMRVDSVRINWPQGRQRRRTYTLVGVLEADNSRVEVQQAAPSQTYWLTDRG
jgi:hypothetical protein